jgi:hypothetical protein
VNDGNKDSGFSGCDCASLQRIRKAHQAVVPYEPAAAHRRGGLRKRKAVFFRVPQAPGMEDKGIFSEVKKSTFTIPM